MPLSSHEKSHLTEVRGKLFRASTDRNKFKFSHKIRLTQGDALPRENSFVALNEMADRD